MAIAEVYSPELIMQSTCKRCSPAACLTSSVCDRIRHSRGAQGPHVFCPTASRRYGFGPELLQALRLQGRQTLDSDTEGLCSAQEAAVAQERGSLLSRLHVPLNTVLPLC